MNVEITEQQRQQILNSQQFNDLMGESLKGLKVPFDKIRDGYLRGVLDKIMDKCPFYALKINEEAYIKLYTQDFSYMEATIQQKAIELLLSSRPCDLFELVILDDILPNEQHATVPVKAQYLELVNAMMEHNKAINDVIEPIQVEHFETVYNLFVSASEKQQKEQIERASKQMSLAATAKAQA